MRLACRLSLIFVFTFMIISADEMLMFYKGSRIYNAKSSSLPVFIDGKLSDEVWSSTKSESLEQAVVDVASPFYKTEARFFCNKDILYFSFNCLDDKISSIVNGVVEKDSLPDKEDFIQLFLQNGESEEVSYRFIFYPSGGLSDIKINKEKTDVKSDLEWNSKSLEVAVGTSESGWSVEGKVSLVELFGKGSDDQPYYRFNIFRSRPEKGWDEVENSSYQTMNPNNLQIPSGKGCLFIQSMKQMLPKEIEEKGLFVNLVYNSLAALEIPISSKQINIDGDISDVITGGSAVPVTFKPLKGDNSKLDNLTEAWVLSTQTDLVIAFKCYDKSMDDLVTKDKFRDEAMWGDDEVEIFLNIGNTSAKDYYHIGVNASGSIYDSFNNDASWNGEGITASSKKMKDHWTLEVKIPYLNLDMTKVKKEFGNPWRFNITRHRPPHANGEILEEAAWSPTGSEKSHVPEKFGYLFLELMGASIKKK